MSRRSKKTELSPDAKRLARQKRAQERREARKSGMTTDHVATKSTRPERTPHQEEQFWARTRDHLAAAKILNDHRERPWWLSIIAESGTPPISGYYPCSMVLRGGRWYYGFLFREHRDRTFKKWGALGAKKEITQ